MNFPEVRLRRLRRTPELRSLVRETQLSPTDFILPLFAVSGENVREEIPSLPGHAHLSVDRIIQEADQANREGIRAVILFGLPDKKDPEGKSSLKGPVQKAIKALKSSLPGLVVITDVCLCQYTDHGHCGVLSGRTVENDRTLELLAETALSHARAGADIVAPSDMMDGRVQAIRKRLDDNGHQDVAIMAYSVKFASAFYGPFREAAHSAPAQGDRKSYQMDPPNRREALREAELDAAEGADILMVKPALAYLDLIRDLRERFHHPIAAYNVSGEYAMVKAAAEKGWVDERAITLESLVGIKRAGADLILTYHAREAARWLG